MLKVYTQDNCKYCTILINNLAEWGLAFQVINITNNPIAKLFLKERHHRTVPQLYLDDFNVNAGYDTEEFTEEVFYDRLDVFIEDHSFEEIQSIIEKYDANKRIF